jgi:DNA gyrase/topoisomerase IV subunit B
MVTFHNKATYLGLNEHAKRGLLTSTLTNTDGKIQMKKSDIKCSPAFIKIFDEILTNASDHVIRTKGEVKNIEVTTNKDGSITIYNDGPGIPIEFHKEAIF